MERIDREELRRIQQNLGLLQPNQNCNIVVGDLTGFENLSGLNNKQSKNEKSKDKNTHGCKGKSLAYGYLQSK